MNILLPPSAVRIRTRSVVLAFVTFVTFAASVPSSFAADVPEPLSDQVKTMFTRVQGELDDAEHPPLLEQYAEENLSEWVRGSLSVLFAPIGTSVQVSAAGNALEGTACFRYDLWDVEQKIRDIREKIVQAQEDRNIY